MPDKIINLIIRCWTLFNWHCLGKKGNPCKVCGFYKASHYNRNLEFDRSASPCNKFSLTFAGGNPLKARMKLKICNGEIVYYLYQQDGSMQKMNCKDTPDNRLYVSWFKAHDRYTPRKTQ